MSKKSLTALALVISVSFVSLTIPSKSAKANEESPLKSLVYRNNIPVITVRKLPEKSANIPATVHVIQQELIEDGNIQTPSDIAALTPGFSFNDPFGRYNPAPSFRGLIQPGLGDDPSVGFFNDGLYLSGRSSINSLGFDLESVEIAKGPQNALYGRNSFGGAINAVSKRPTQTTEFFADGLAGTHNRYQMTAGFNAPLNDWVATRVALYKRDWGGYFDNSAPNGPDIGRERTMAGRASIAFTPSSTRDVILRLTHIEDDDSQPKGFLVPANCAPRNGDAQLRLYCGELPDRPEDEDSLEANYVGDNGYERTHTRATLEWEETLSQKIKWTTLLGGAIEDSSFIRDDDYQSVQAARAGIDTERYDLQFDSRLNLGQQYDRWSGLVGVSGYFFDNAVDRLDQYYVLGETQPSGPQIDNSTTTAGIYGSLTHRWDSGIALTADARYQWEAKDLRSTTNAVTTGKPLDLNDSWTAFTPKLTLSWQENPGQGLLFFGSVAQGYKTGGFNDRANIFDDERTYDPEENITYEIGAKNIRLHDTLAADLGAFWIDWTDQQVTAYSTAAATQNFFINNAGETTVKGIEASLRWRPLPNLGFDVGYTYADARYDSYNDPDLANISGYAPDGDVSGNQLPRYSPHQLVVTSQYDTPSPFKNWDWSLGGQFTYESAQYSDNSNTAKTGARSLLNLQAGLKHQASYIGVWVDNALNEKDPATAIPWTDASQGFRREYLVIPQDGTTIGLRASIRW